MAVNTTLLNGKRPLPVLNTDGRIRNLGGNAGGERRTIWVVTIALEHEPGVRAPRSTERAGRDGPSNKRCNQGSEQDVEKGDRGDLHHQSQETRWGPLDRTRVRCGSVPAKELDKTIAP